MSGVIFELGFVRPSSIERYLGITSDQLNSKKKTGQFVDGVHYRKAADGNIYWNFENIKEWCATSEPLKAG